MKLLKKSLCLFLIMLFIFCNISTFTFVSSASTSKKTYYYMTADAEPRFSTNKKDENYFYITLRDSQGIYSFSLQAYNEKNKKYDDLISGNGSNISNKNPNFTYTEKTKTIRISKKYFTTTGKYILFKLQTADVSTKDKPKRNTLYSRFQVKRLAKKDSDGNYFYMNCSPRITTNNLGSSTNTTATTNFDTKAKALTGLSINVVDNTGISNLTLEDMNNTNKAAESKNYSTGTEKQTNITYKLDLSKYTEKDGWYRIKITVTDKRNMKRVCQRFYKVCSYSIKLTGTDNAKETTEQVAKQSTLPSFKVTSNTEIFKETKYTKACEMQGMCSDGTYLYFGMHDSNDFKKGVLGKVSIKTGKLVAEVKNHVYGHVNDICYNPKDNTILIVSLDSYGTVYKADAKTLNYKGKFSLKENLQEAWEKYSKQPYCGIGGIAYSKTNDKYVCLMKMRKNTTDNYYGYAILNDEFKVEKLFKCERKSVGSYRFKGGIEADENYIYQTYMGNKGTKNNDFIGVYNYDGKLINKIQLSTYGLEGVTKISNTKFYTSYANDTIRNTVVKISK